MANIILRTKKQKAAYYFGWTVAALIALQLVFLLIWAIATIAG